MKRERVVLSLVLLLSFILNSFGQGSNLTSAIIEVELVGDVKPFVYSLTRVSYDNEVALFKLTLKADKDTIPNPFSLKWYYPIVNTSTLWKSNSYYQKFLYTNWSSGAKVTSRATNNAPVLSLVSDNDKNQLTFACSDALNTITLKAGVKEENAMFECEVVFFEEESSPLKEYTAYIRIDTRDINFSQSIKDVAAWWEGFDQYKPMKVPEHARLPMYSSWYSFHQNLKALDVIEQCRLAKELGYESVIIDDGWQTLDANRGYSFTGDWKPERIPQMKEFVDKVHELGMKFILWYSVPYIGDKSENFKKFEGKYLTYWGGEWGGSYTLDPRYPVVREFLITTFEEAMQEWGLDGFKLDFVDEFIAQDTTKLTLDNGRDYASVNEATDRLLTDITKRLKKINPEVLIEFRQSYIGPLMRKYGNMFRAGDCPNSYLFNRVRTTDLKLTSGNTAVHSDMLMWNKEEPVQAAALQLLNVMFSVPQLSVKINELPADHLKMVKHLTSYWLSNKDVLLDGDFIPVSPSLSYPVLSSRKDNKVIYGIYADMMVTIDEVFRELHILNAKPTDTILLNLTDVVGSVTIETYDCMGNTLLNYRDRLIKGLQILNVPPSGIIKITRN